MNKRDAFLRYLTCYAAKDLAGISAMLADGCALRDWNISVRGRHAVEAETRRNFATARTINIQVLSLFEGPDLVAGELKILVDETVELYVVDVLEFDAALRISAIRAFKGRGD
jgi:SnoaL-like domain